ncbi:hypothetical protein B296_00002182 [Ensete ventricosum]|uniref:Uncharacterized protein n=1 Tax=Ensete ventricosum TaxID=4639 RepID=A0A427B2Y8_ENSVE|nr:hypothetical protein B296_00002182 [Ensete ventricosum]
MHVVSIWNTFGRIDLIRSAISSNASILVNIRTDYINHVHGLPASHGGRQRSLSILVGAYPSCSYAKWVPAATSQSVIGMRAGVGEGVRKRSFDRGCGTTRGSRCGSSSTRVTRTFDSSTRNPHLPVRHPPAWLLVAGAGPTETLKWGRPRKKRQRSLVAMRRCRRAPC